MVAARRTRPARRPRLRLVFASAELAPLLRTGGLGDAVAGLAAALVARGHEVTCLLPAWSAALTSADAPDWEPAAHAAGLRGEHGRWRAGRIGEVRVELCDLPGRFDRDALQTHHKDIDHFVLSPGAVLSRLADLPMMGASAARKRHALGAVAPLT